ncbi:hypothetical protein L6452_38780 [Arctium lappa]|uniref:Uncharacterized protein n=1 Tax=Arctium lappa TaxID=4217 RepID=A0ACB8XRM8_ARCLA|nr:hypothetical protein L6452_38780 [Arctium lappa]
MVTRSTMSTMHKVVVVSPGKIAIDKVGTGHAPSGKPRQFTTTTDVAHYELLVDQKLNATTEADEAEIAAELVVEGRSWELDGRRRCIQANHLTTEAAMLESPLCQTGDASDTTVVGTGITQIDPQSASVPNQSTGTLMEVLVVLQKLNSILTSIEDRMKESERSNKSELPLFPPSICLVAGSPEDDPFTNPTVVDPTNNSEGL